MSPAQALAEARPRVESDDRSPVSLSRSRPLFVLPAAGARDPRPGIAGVPEDALRTWIGARGERAFRARQIADEIWGRGADRFDDMRTLPASLRADLTASFRASTMEQTDTRFADEGLTEKALHRLDDGRLVESVLMRYPARGGRRERATVCISSQAGCAVGCPFCATGELGLERNLDVAEIVDQVRFWRRRLQPDGEHITNVVFMGMGEPLLNADAVLDAAAALSDPRRFGLGARRITISTSGVIPGIEKLTALAPQYTLAVSLHAARAALRDVLVPLNRSYPVDALVQAATRYADVTGRRVSYEYVMIDGINDTADDATALAALLRRTLAHVNLIPMNPVAHTPWQPSPPARVASFVSRLREAGISTTVRRNRGIEIGAACGQLAAERAGEPSRDAVARRRELLERESASALVSAR